MSIKKLKSLVFCAILLSFVLVFAARADVFFGDKKDTAPQTQEEKQKEKTSRIKQVKPKKTIGVPQEIDGTGKDNTDNEVRPEGPPYPFIFENLDKDRLVCKATPFIEPEQKNLSTIKKGNNLTRKPGSPSKAQGNYIQISGLVTDENCLPIQGAVIEIWQMDSQGKYEWEYAKKSYWELPVPGKDNNFLFSGSAQTDNLGQFNFLTIFPGYTQESAPYINVIVKRNGYDELHTRIYFTEHPRNENDQILLGLGKDAKASVLAVAMNIAVNNPYATRSYYFPIVMRGISAYKRF